MATTNTNVHNSKIVLPEEHAQHRKAAQLRKRRGHGGKNKPTVPNQLKKFDPETFEVRTGAADLLSTPHKGNVVAAFGKFLNKNSEDAYNLIWAMTFQPEEKKPLLLKVLGLSPEMVPDMPMLLKELAAQYRTYVDPSFMLAPDMSDEVKPAFNALYTESTAAALFVHDMCANYLVMNPDDHVASNLRRLSSDAENRIHGGIVDLIKAVVMPDRDDRYALSAYLKPRYKKIHDLLKAMADVKAAEKKQSTTAPASALANLETLCQEAGLTLKSAPAENPQEPQATDSKQELKDAKVQVTIQVATDTPDEDNSPKDFNYGTVASHYELFNSLAAATAEMKEIGFDTALFFRNMAKVRGYLELATQLADAGFSPSQYPDKEKDIADVLQIEAQRLEVAARFNP